MPKTRVYPLRWIDAPSASEARARKLVLAQGNGIILSTATVGDVATVTIAAEGDLIGDKGREYACDPSVAVGSPVYCDASGHVAPARADAVGKLAHFVVTTKPTANTCTASATGTLSGLVGLVAGAVYFLAPAGGFTLDVPGTGNLIQPLFVATGASVAEINVFPFRVLA